MTLKPDQEPAILALTNAVKNTLSARGVACRLENSPKGDAHGMSNGESESSVAIAQGLARTLKDHVEFKIEKMINPKSPLLPWLVEYVGIRYTLFSFDEKSKDGMTPFRKLKGRDWVISLPSFGECVDYRVRTQHKLEARWDIGIYLGIRLHTTEKIIGAPQGVVVVQSIRRKPADQQWNADLIEKLVGTPWAPSAGKQKSNQEALELPEAVSIDVEQPAVEPRPVESAEMKPHFKRVYLRQTDFDKFGYSAQCRACTLLRLGMDRQGILHTEECRLRMVQRLQETEYGRKRIQIAEKRGREAKEETEKEKKLKVTLEPEVLPRDNPGGPASGSGIKRPAPDPPRIQGWCQIPVKLNWIPRWKKVQAQHNHLEGPSEMQTQQVLQSNPWMTKQLSPIYCFLIAQVFLEHFMLNFKNLQKFYLFVRSILTLILKHLGIMMTFLESPWTLRWSKQRDVKSAKLFRQWASGSQFPGRRTRR